QQDSAASMVRDVVLSQADLPRRSAPLRDVPAERDRIRDVAGYAVVRDLEAGLCIAFDPGIVVEDLVAIDDARARWRLVEDDPGAERHRPMVPADDVLLDRRSRFAEDDDAIRSGPEHDERGFRLVVRDRVVSHVRERAGVHRLNAVLLVPVDDIVVDARAGRQSERRPLVREPLANRHGVALLTTPEKGIAVPDEREVIVVDPPVERVFESHPLVAIVRAATRVERAADRESPDGYSVSIADVDENVLR